MTSAETLLPEYDHETATTRALLERVPADRAAWSPHEKSMTLGRLAMHIVNLTRWATYVLERTEFDLNPRDERGEAPDGRPDEASRLVTPPYESTERLLELYDSGVASVRARLIATTDGEFLVPWALKNGGKLVFSMPRLMVFRSFFLNHTIHHRGQLTVYLRLVGVPLPSIYGPTADMQP